MEIQNNSLRILVEDAFGFNLSSQNLLVASNPQDEAGNNQNCEVTVYDEGLRSRAGKRLCAEVLNEQKNLEDVVQKADELLQSDQNVSTSQEEVDRKWINECLDGAGKSYNEDLKVYWAKLLAGEIRVPGSYSLRAIDFMKKLSKKDAERLREMSKLVLYDQDNVNVFILREDNSNYYSFSDISFLVELQLINTAHNVVLKCRFNDNSGGNMLFLHGDYAYLLRIMKKNYDMPVYFFTELGKEVFSIIDDQEVNVDYLKDFSKKITSPNSKIEITGGNYVVENTKGTIIDNDNFFHYPEEVNNKENTTSGVEV